MLIKLIGGCMIVLCGTMTGIYLFRLSQRRVRALNEYIAFLSHCQNMIAYCGADILHILSSCTEYELLGGMMKECCDKLRSGMELTKAWSISVSGVEFRGIIASEDKKLFTAFADDFGTMDADGEINRICLCREETMRRYEELYSQTEAKRRFYRTVGMFCGMLLAVVMI